MELEVVTPASRAAAAETQRPGSVAADTESGRDEATARGSAMFHR
jgi:hypothetical protein